MVRHAHKFVSILLNELLVSVRDMIVLLALRDVTVDLVELGLSLLLLWPEIG